MDISSRGKYPSCELSNFAQHYFVLDRLLCFSMEGFLQSLKFKDEEEQKVICELDGIKAKKTGRMADDWKETQILWWKGVAYKRDSQEYQDLLDRVFESLGQNVSLMKVLLATGEEDLTHTIGSSDITDTVLTEEEFCSRLLKLREKIKKTFKK